MFQVQNRETINSTWKVAVSFKIIMTTRVTRLCFTTQHQTCKIKTKTTVCKTKTCMEQSSSRSAPILDIFQTHLKSHLFNLSFPSVWLYYWLHSLTIFVQNPWSRLCCIRLFKFVIITLHYITLYYITRPTPIFWSQTGLVLRPTVSDHITGSGWLNG